MPQVELNSQTLSGKESSLMFETVLLLSFCGLVGLASVAVVIWLAASGALFSLDGLVFALISLTIGAFFMFNIAWSFYTGELRALLGGLRKGKSADPPAKEPPATPKPGA